jgi:carboxymethylenebutenolidase
VRQDARVVVTQEHVDVPVGDRRMRTFLAAPQASGPHPGIVFYSDIFQLTDSTLRWCTRLAGYGFAVAAPEIYHRIEPPGTVLGFDDEGKARGQADADATPVADFDADIAALLAYLAGHPAVAGATLGAAGHCTGGHIAFRAAMRPEVRATVCWYATGLHDGKLGKDPDAGSLARADEIGGDLLLIFGTRDPHTPEAARAVIRRRLDASPVRFTWSEYDTEHAFGRDEGHRYDPEASDLAFAETVALFRRSLGGQP